MNETETILWPGKSGTEYRYWIYPINTTFTNSEEVSANYIFAKETSPGTFSPIYIGETGNLAQRLADHEKEDCVRRNGATHIHVHTTPAGEKARKAEELDLILRWQPPCNEKHVG